MLQLAAPPLWPVHTLPFITSSSPYLFKRGGLGQSFEGDSQSIPAPVSFWHSPTAMALTVVFVALGICLLLGVLWSMVRGWRNELRRRRNRAHDEERGGQQPHQYNSASRRQQTQQWLDSHMREQPRPENSRRRKHRWSARSPVLSHQDVKANNGRQSNHLSTDNTPLDPPPPPIPDYLQSSHDMDHERIKFGERKKSKKKAHNASRPPHPQGVARSSAQKRSRQMTPNHVSFGASRNAPAPSIAAAFPMQSLPMLGYGYGYGYGHGYDGLSIISEGGCALERPVETNGQEPLTTCSNPVTINDQCCPQEERHVHWDDNLPKPATSDPAVGNDQCCYQEEVHCDDNQPGSVAEVCGNLEEGKTGAVEATPFIGNDQCCQEEQRQEPETTGAVEDTSCQPEEHQVHCDDP